MGYEWRDQFSHCFTKYNRKGIKRIQFVRWEIIDIQKALKSAQTLSGEVTIWNFVFPSGNQTP